MANPPGIIEVMDAPQAASSAAGVLARLAEREEQRAVAAAKRLEELQVAADPRESVDAFMEEFSSRRQQLEAALQAAAGSGSSSSGGSAAALAELAGQIAELEQAVADATYFLPSYDLRQATLALAALREQQETAAAALQPRKKFSFNRKAPAAKPAAAGAPAAAGRQEPGGGGAAAGTGAGSAQPDAGSGGCGSGVRPRQPGDAPPAQQQEQQEGCGAAASGAAHSDGTAIRGLRGQVVGFPREQAAGREFTLSDLEDCTVFLLAPLAALFLHGLRRCRVYTGPVAGACFVEGAADSVLMLAARQVRIHTSQRTDFYLRVRSHPIIEHSSALRFAPYAPTYPGAAPDLGAQGLEADGGMWQQVHDFGWLRSTPSPHWAVLPEGERLGAPEGAPGGSAAQPAGSPTEGGRT